MRMSGNLLNGITREQRVTNDDAANPRPTLKNGHHAPVAGRARFPEVRHCTCGESGPPVSRVSNRDRIAWAAKERVKEPTLTAETAEIAEKNLKYSRRSLHAPLLNVAVT